MAEISQLPGSVDIEIVKGDDFSFQLDFGIDITGYILEAKVVKDASATPEEVVSFTISNVNLSTGKIILTLTDTQTNALQIKTYKWYFKWTTTSTAVRKMLQGDFTVTR